MTIEDIDNFLAHGDGESSDSSDWNDIKEECEETAKANPVGLERITHKAALIQQRLEGISDVIFSLVVLHHLLVQLKCSMTNSIKSIK